MFKTVELEFLIPKSEIILSMSNNESLNVNALNTYIEYVKNTEYFKQNPIYIPYTLLEMVRNQVIYLVNNDADISSIKNFVVKYIEELNQHITIEDKEFMIHYLSTIPYCNLVTSISIDEKIKLLLPIAKNYPNLKCQYYLYDTKVTLLRALLARSNEYKQELVDTIHFIKNISIDIDDINMRIHI